jgi:PAS domain S-box-containing protein
MLSLLGALLLIAIFVADLWTPISMAIPICYVAALVLVVALPGRHEKILAAATFTALMILNYFLSPPVPGLPIWVIIINYSLAVLMTWIVTILGLRRLRLEAVMRADEHMANERLAQLNTIYASAPVGLCFVDRELRYVSINDALAAMNGHPAEYHIGKTIRAAVPEIADAVAPYYRKVIDSGRPVVDVEIQGVTAARPNEQRSWSYTFYPVQNASGDLLGVNVAVRDTTRRKQAEADTLFLLDLAECIRFAANADELMWAVAVALGEHLRGNRCAFVEIDSEHDRFMVQRDYHPHVPSLVGSYTLSAFSPAVISAGQAGQTIIIFDVARDQRTAAYVEAYRQTGVCAFIATPLLRDGQLVSGLIVAAIEPRDWSERDAALLNVVAERTWLAVEKLRLDHALRERDAALRDADRRKDEFLATLAHELRNPLALIRNVVSLLQSPGSSESEFHWGRDIIDRQVNYLTRLTDDLFDVSRITREQLDLQKEPVNLAEVITAAVESSRPLIDQRGHELTVNVCQKTILVEADKIRLTQVFMNLLNNAAKYTPQPGRIWLSVDQTGERAVVRVKDTGIGLATESLPRLFDLFYQVDRSFTRAEGGLGLGLTLVRRLVEMHGGIVEVHSPGVNQGSEFIVHLPVLHEQLQVRPSRDEVGDGLASPTRLRRILVADDFPESAATLARLLQQDGNEVKVAQDGDEAVETAAHFRPDVVVLDIAMPKLNGYDAARKIREQPWGKNMVLIALTGWGQQQDRRRTQEAGFDAHLTKPINYAAITELLTNLSADALRRDNQRLPR